MEKEGQRLKLKKKIVTFSRVFDAENHTLPENSRLATLRSHVSKTFQKSYTERSIQINIRLKKNTLLYPFELLL